MNIEHHAPNQSLGQPLNLTPEPPWPDPVDGKLLLNDLAATLKRFVILPPWAAETLALWAVHTYAFQFRDVTTYIGLESPEKRCGKTTLLAVLSELVQRPVVAANISSPALFRVIEETRPTLLIDEADSFLRGNEELRGILNSGYTRKTAYVVRVAYERKRGSSTLSPTSSSPLSLSEPLSASQPAAPSHDLSTINPQLSTRLARFSSWCPKVMAAIGRLPDTLADRCILIRMQRKTSLETCERLRNLDANGTAIDLRRRCARFVLDNQSAIADANPAIPPDLNDRAADIWEPLFAIADLAGGTWPQFARDAAVRLMLTAQNSNAAAAFLLDIRIAFLALQKERMFSRELVQVLNLLPERPWAVSNNHGKPLTELELASRLRPYGVRPKTLWIDGISGKGYLSEELLELFNRYVPKQMAEEALARQVEPREPEPQLPAAPVSS